MDEVARTVSTAFTVSNDLRHDLEMTLLFRSDPPASPRRICIYGGRVRYLNPDERSTAALLKNALVRSVAAQNPVESSPGLVVSLADPLAELSEFLGGPNPLWLTEGGAPIRGTPLPADFSAVLSDPTDPSNDERAILEASSAIRLSVGPRSLRSSQVVDLLLNEADLQDVGTGRIH